MTQPKFNPRTFRIQVYKRYRYSTQIDPNVLLPGPQGTNIKELTQSCETDNASINTLIERRVETPNLGDGASLSAGPICHVRPAWRRRG